MCLIAGCSYAPSPAMLAGDDEPASDGPSNDGPPSDGPGDGPPPDTAAFTCNASYTFEPTLTSSYRRVATATAWLPAEQNCEADGGHLVVITSQAEEDHVIALAQGLDTWIGISDRATEASWIWVTDTEFTYDDFASGQPGNNNNPTVDQDCGEWGIGWHDDLCSTPNPFICECDGQPAIASRYTP